MCLPGEDIEGKYHAADTDQEHGPEGEIIKECFSALPWRPGMNRRGRDTEVVRTSSADLKKARSNEVEVCASVSVVERRQASQIFTGLVRVAKWRDILLKVMFQLQAETRSNQHVARPFKFCGMKEAGIQVRREEKLIGKPRPKQLEHNQFVIHVG